MSATHPIPPRRGDTLLPHGRAAGDMAGWRVERLVRPFACAQRTPDETRHGCWWVTARDRDGQEEEFVVTADVSGLTTRTFVGCSGSRR